MAQGLADLVLSQAQRREPIDDPTLKRLGGSLAFSGVSDTFALVSAAVERKRQLRTPVPAPVAPAAAPPAAMQPPVPRRRPVSSFAGMAQLTGLEPKAVATPLPTPAAATPARQPQPQRRERLRPDEQKEDKTGFESMYQRPNRSSEFFDRQDRRRLQVDEAEKNKNLKALMRFIDSLEAAVGIKSNYQLYRLDFDAGAFVDKDEIDWRDVVDKAYWASIDQALKDARRFAPRFARGKTDYVVLTHQQAASAIRDLVQFYYTKNTAATKGRYMQPAADLYMDTLYSNAAFDLRELDELR